MKKILALMLALAMLLGCTALAEDAAPALTKDLVILFTSDAHCGIDSGFGYAGLATVRDVLAAKNHVILVDNGDAIQGEPVGTMTKGEAIIELMNTVGYEVAIPGNHEFDYGMDNFLGLVEKANYPYISANFTHNGELVFQPYVIKEYDGVKVAFVGVTTPKTFTSSTPTYFQDENGNYVYGFSEDETGEKLYAAVQSAVDAARAEGATYVVAMAHLGNEDTCAPWRYDNVITNTNGIDVFLDGHSHDTDQVKVTNKDGVEVPRSGCGTKLEGVGYARISAKDGSVTTGLYTWDNDVSAPALLGIEYPAAAIAAANRSAPHPHNQLQIIAPAKKGQGVKPLAQVQGRR